MQSIENRDQFRQEAQQVLQHLEEQINDLTDARYRNNQLVTEEASQLINRLKSQHDRLKEALEKLGTESDKDWSAVKPEAQSLLDDIAHAGQTKQNASRHGKWQISTGQSDRGDAPMMTGLGDRAGMEDPQSGLDDEASYSSFGNPYRAEKKQDKQPDKKRNRHND